MENNFLHVVDAKGEVIRIVYPLLFRHLTILYWVRFFADCLLNLYQSNLNISFR